MANANAELWQSTYTAKDHSELMDTYKKWAADYDHDTVDVFGYVAPQVASEALDDCLESKKSYILDAGCGTGLVGEVLKEEGYSRMDALDYSKEMLDLAEEKGVYRDHIQADLCKPLDMEDNTYDAVVCVGTFTYGHVKAEAFDELIRITKPGGYICFTIRDGAYDEYGYRQRMVELEADKAWEQLEMRNEDYLKNEGVSCKMCSYKVL